MKWWGHTFILTLCLCGCSRPVMQELNDASLPLTNSPAVNLPAALADARHGRLVLLDFTGSDWCPPCMLLQKSVFEQSSFLTYARSNLVVVRVDFPGHFRLTPEAAATNNLLAQKFQVEGVPTLIALDADGKVIWRHLGLIEGGPDALIRELAAAAEKAGHHLPN